MADERSPFLIDNRFLLFMELLKSMGIVPKSWITSTSGTGPKAKQWQVPEPQNTMIQLLSG
jgi:hypothetical protein